MARKSRVCAEAYPGYAAQENPKIDAARTEKDPFRMETSYSISPGRTLRDNDRHGRERKN
jgi:hypothetical protein